MLQRHHLLPIVELGLRWHVALSLFVYGFAKTVQFSPTSDIADPVNSLTGQQLMWAFYGYSIGYAKFLGIMEVLGAGLLLFRRTLLLGCLVVTTVLVNVIAQDIAFGVLEGALRAAIVYQALTVIILWMNRAQVLRIWHAFLAPEPTNHTIHWYWLAVGAAVVLAISLQLEFWITH